MFVYQDLLYKVNASLMYSVPDDLTQMFLILQFILANESFILCTAEIHLTFNPKGTGKDLEDLL